MKRVNLLFIGFVVLIALSVGFSSCGESISSKDLQVVSEGYQESGTFYNIKFKNISNKVLNGAIHVKVVFSDGTTQTDYCDFDNMHPGDVQLQSIRGANSDYAKLQSWSFIDE